MSDRLQKHFEDVSGKQSNLKRLHSQWQFDKELIPKALQTIGGLFPHYSRHDQSHSDQILVNIERLLGDERIKLLSATDTWLLLEAAYWHDIGMVVPHKAIQEAFQDSEFESYRQQVANTTGHELQKFAHHFCVNMANAFLGADTPLDAMEKFRAFMAEWFRKKHHTRSENAINNPWQEIGLSSPRTELIPKRLFRLLGQVCGMHGRSFDEVLDQLPFKEAGMANDDCHPRFIACLLRLGDLLDIDDNRFCPVMQQIAGEGRPALSKAHEDKHTSIRHFRLDPERIEITAVCATIDGYVEQWRWLDGLRSEVQRQMSRWQDIAPERSLGLLPTIGEIKVEMAGRKLITQPGARTEFRLNSERALKLLQGENLYKRTDTIRELLQNAVDATLLRLWQTERKEFDSGAIKPGDFSNPYFKKYPICAELVRSTDAASSADKIKWTLTITDQGSGMTLSDLSFLMNVAGSGGNTAKQAIIQRMPEWLRPSGNFGIGLQSVFMWTEEVRITTKSLHANDVLKVTLHSPSGPKLGLVEIERMEGNHLDCAVGTALTFDLETAAVSFVSYQLGEKSVIQVVMEQYDALLDKELPLETVALIKAAALFSKHSPVEVQWRYVNLDFVLSTAATTDQEEAPWDFFPETNSRFQANLLKTSDHPWFNTTVFYRGQAVENKGLSRYHFFSYQLDLYAATASDWLTFDRNTWSTKGQENIEKVVTHNLKLWVERNKQKLLETNKSELSALAKLTANAQDNEFQPFWQSLAHELSDEWQDLGCLVQVAGQNATTDCYRNILQSGWTLTSSSRYGEPDNFPSKPTKLAVTGEIEMHFLVQAWCGDSRHGIRYTFEKPEEAVNRRAIPRGFLELIEIGVGGEQLQVDRLNLTLAIEQAVMLVHHTKCRLLVPMNLLPKALNLHRLTLPKDMRISGVNRVLEHVPVPTPHVVLPHVISSGWGSKTAISLERLDEFLAWVHKNLATAIPLSEVKAIYAQLITHIDDELMKDSGFWKKYRVPCQPIVGLSST
nr:hypothetical protein [uncultured Rhodoferax sp.]